MMQGYKTFQALVGIFQNQERRYVEYVDGSLMTDGFFNDVKGQFFSDIYSTDQNTSNHFMITMDGNIYRSQGALILCEKSLIKDLAMCIQSSNLQSNGAMSTSSSIKISTHNSASLCIEYCRGQFNQSYAVLNTKVCSCANSIMFDPKMPENATGIKRPLSLCQNSRSYSKIGTDGNNGKNAQHFLCFLVRRIQLFHLI